jgi:polar amino acid transport system substrate-binding protein
MNLIFKAIILMFFSMLSLVSITSKAVENIDDIVWITENAPPHNYLNKKNKLAGSAIKIVRNILKTTVSKKTVKDIKILPWEMAYKNTLENKNYALFSTSRTKDRESLFKWAGPISTSRIAIISKKDSGIKITNLNELKKYKVGAVHYDVGQQLINSAVKDLQLDLVENTKDSILQLTSGTVDLIVGNESVIKYLIKDNGLKTKDYKTVYILQKVDQWIAFNLLTSDALVQMVQNSLNNK